MCLCVNFKLSHLGLCLCSWETSSKPVPLRLSCYPNTSKQSRPLAGAGRGGGARAHWAQRGCPPEGEAGPLLKPWTPGREQPGEGRGQGQSSARSLLEGDGPARLQSETFRGVGERLAEVRSSGRALSAGSKHPGSLRIPHSQTPMKARIRSHGWWCSRSCLRLPKLRAEKEVCRAWTQ